MKILRTEQKQAAQDLIHVLRERGIPPDQWAVILNAANEEGALDDPDLDDCADSLEKHIHKLIEKYGPGIEGTTGQKG